MKMIKVENCGECPYRDMVFCGMGSDSDYWYVCHHDKFYTEVRVNMDSIHPDCPLDDYKDWKGVVDRSMERMNDEADGIRYQLSSGASPRSILREQLATIAWLRQIIQEEIERESK